MSSKGINVKNIEKIIEILKNEYPDAICSLEHKNPLQLLIATQLAAQCTDKRVNIVCKDLFKKYKNANDFAKSSQVELEQDIKSTGFYRNKAKNIIACCNILVEEYDGKVPGKMDDLLKLPGVGRKTANVIMGDAFGVPGIVIDTHAKRISKRLGLTEYTDPVKIEFDLMEKIPKEYWTDFGHMLVYHGRAICKAVKPKCPVCPLHDYCGYRNG